MMEEVIINAEMRNRIAPAISFWVLLLLSVSVPGPSQAMPPGTAYDRIHALQDRIDEGITTGKLSKREAQKVQAALDGIRKKLDAAPPAKGRRRANPNAKDIIKQLDSLSLEIESLMKNDEIATEPYTPPDPAGNLYERIRNCQKMIDNGRESGDLTLAEEVEVQRTLNNIKNDLSIRIKNDYMTPDEKKDLSRRLDELEKRIKVLKQNSECRESV